MLAAAASIPVHTTSLGAVHIATALHCRAHAVITSDATMTAVLRDRFGVECASRVVETIASGENLALVEASHDRKP